MIPIKDRKTRDILTIIIIIFLGAISIYGAYRFYGPQAVRMTLAGCGIILYIVVKDILDKRKKRKEEEEAKNGGRKVMSLNKDEKSRVGIGDIAHRSTRRIDPERKSENSDNDNTSQQN